jgi:von Willebrand factor type A domain
MDIRSPNSECKPVASTPVKPRLAEFLKRVNPDRGRVILCVDATASRQQTWDTAAELQAKMFEAASGLDVQLVYYRGGECVASRWISNASSLTTIMRQVTCRSGLTQIGKALMHAAKEHKQHSINALVLISDACEEQPGDLYAHAHDLGVPAFLFQEGDDPGVASVYARIAEITKGAVVRFDAGAAQRLADLLKAVAAFASGGVTALAAQNTEAATLLLTQIKK